MRTEPVPAAPVLTQQTLENLALFVTPLAFFSALLYFFAWVRAHALFGYFGVDLQLVGYSSHDYLLRSSSLAFPQASWLLLTAVAFYVALRSAESVISRSPSLRRPLTAAFAGSGTALLVCGFVVALQIGRPVPPSPASLALIVGAMLAELGVTCATTGRPGPYPVLLRRVAVAGVIVIGSFWSCALHATAAGQEAARALAADPGGKRPAVVLYSEGDLNLKVAGVRRTELPATGEYRYRYSGLFLLAFNAKRWILLPDGWKRGRAPAVIVPEGKEIRVELSTRP